MKQQKKLSRRGLWSLVAGSMLLGLVGSVAQAQVPVNIDFTGTGGNAGPLYSGTGPAGGSGTIWNSVTPSGQTGLTNADGTATPLSVSVSGHSGVSYDSTVAGTFQPLLHDYIYDVGDKTFTVTIGGLVSGNAYDLYYLGAGGHWAGYGCRAIIGATTNECRWSPLNYETWGEGTNYVKFSAVTADGSGQIVATIMNNTIRTDETDLAGMQVVMIHTETKPVIANSAATNIAYTSANFNGSLISTGSAATAVWLYMGAADGTNNKSVWATNYAFGVMTSNAVQLTTNLAGLSQDTTYYYRFYASNSVGDNWAVPTASFTTPALAALMPVNIDFGSGPVYTGTGPAGGGGTYWNGANPNATGLANALGIATPLSVTVSGHSGTTSWGTGGTFGDLLNDYIYDNGDKTFTVTVDGLVSGQRYDLYFMGVGGASAGYGARVNIGATTKECTWNPKNYETWVAYQNYVKFNSVAANGSGQIVATITPNTIQVGEADLAGLQVVEAPSAPDISVQHNGTFILNNDVTPTSAEGTDYGRVVIGAQSASVFTITNAGTGPLLLAGVPAISVSGAQAADFVVTPPALTNIPAGGSTTFTLSFVPVGSGTRQATVTIANNVGSENPYSFAVTGFALSPSAGMPALVNIDFGPGTAYSGFGPAGGSGTFWNKVNSASTNDLKDANGAATYLSTQSTQAGGYSWNGSGSFSDLLKTYLQKGGSGGFTMTIGGLVSARLGSYDLYYMCSQGDYAGYGGTVIIGTNTHECTWSPKNYATWVEGQNYVKFSAITADTNGQILATIMPNSIQTGEAALSGMQVVYVPRIPPGSVFTMR